MKLLFNGSQELANIDIDVDSNQGTLIPKVDALGYHIEGPLSKAELVTDPTCDGLLLNLELSDITTVSLLIGKEDVKKLKKLMNKDAVKFMVKAFI